MDERKSVEQINIERMARLEGIEKKEEAELFGDPERARNLLKTPTVLRAAETPIRLYIDELKEGDSEYYVDYCMLTYNEMVRLLNIKDIQKRNIEELYLRLHKADPEVTKGDIEGLPGNFVNLILMRVGEEESRFLLPPLKRALATFEKILES